MKLHLKCVRDKANFRFAKLQRKTSSNQKVQQSGSERSTHGVGNDTKFEIHLYNFNQGLFHHSKPDELNISTDWKQDRRYEKDNDH